jgi:hypothetical protein
MVEGHRHPFQEDVMNKWIYRLAAGTTLVGLVSSASVASAAPRAPHPVAAVRGSAVVRLTFAPDDEVRTFTFDVRASPYSRPMPGGGADHGLPTDATGTVVVTHRAADSAWTVRFVATVDCLVTAPGIAGFTAVVTEGDGPAAQMVGQRLGFSVSDQGRHDRVGFSWAVVNADQDSAGTWGEGRTGTCMAPAPFAPVVSGDYTVRHAELLPPPAS